MLPIASNMAARMTRELARSALPDAPVRPDPPQTRASAQAPRSQRLLVKMLRHLATTSGGLADRLDRPLA
jgi:hypothetical protein